MEVVASFTTLKLRGGISDDEIADKLGFGSAEALHIQLTNWQLPAWMLNRAPAKERPRKARRPRGGGGTSSELPSAGDATELILGALKRLEHDARDLKKRKEFLQDGRFVVKRGTALTPVHRRGDLPDSVWREICARHGKDPAATEVVREEPTRIEAPGGGSVTPPAPLPALIAVYALSGEPLDELVDKLYLAAEEVNREVLANALADTQAKLELAAAQLARLVRGGEVKKGPPPRELP